MADVDRAAIRRTRRALPRSVRRDAAAALGARWRGSPALAAARRVGAYVPVGGEIDPWCIVAQVWDAGAAVHLPEVVEDADGTRRLRFARHERGGPLSPGAFGIPVPGPDAVRVDPHELDVVLVPLVAFDAAGTRVGMGAGFYDRTFAGHRRDAPAPLLVGLAYAWQERPHLDAQPWDVALDLVLTDRAEGRPGGQSK